MSEMCEATFSNLRLKLDIMGYQQLLGIESLPLVERLLGDLIHTTESFQKLKENESSRQLTLDNVDHLIQPYQQDNAKLVRENNDLHLKILKSQEKYNNEINEMADNIRSKDNKIADVLFLNEQYTIKIKDMEMESVEKTKAINALQMKNSKAVVSMPGGVEQKIAFRRQRMNVDAFLDENFEFNENCNKRSDTESINMMKICDAKIRQTTLDNGSLKKEIECMRKQISSLNVQVKSREEEIVRLKKMLDGGKPVDVIVLENQQSQNERLITSLKMQMDILQERNDSLLYKLSNSETQQLDNLQNFEKNGFKNENENKNKNKNEIFLHNNNDEENIILSQEITSLKDRLEHISLENLKLQNDLKKSNTPEMENNEKTRETYQQLNLHINQLHRDKAALELRISNLLKRQKELCGKLITERKNVKSNRSMTNLPPKAGFSCPNKFNSTNTSNINLKISDFNTLINDISKDRDYWVKETHALKSILGIRKNFKHFNNDTLLCETLNNEKRRNGKNNNVSKKTSNINQQVDNSAPYYSNLLKAVENERDSYQLECTNLQGQLEDLQHLRTTVGQLESEQKCLLEENEKLTDSSIRLRRKIKDIMGDKMDLQREVDELSVQCQYRRSTDCTKTIHVPSLQKSNSDVGNINVQSTIRKLEHEKRKAVESLEKVEIDRADIRRRLKLSTESQLEDRSRLEVKNDEIAKLLMESKTQLGISESRISELQDMLIIKDREIRNFTIELDNAKDEIDKWHNQTSNLKNLKVQMECSKKDVEMRLEKQTCENRRLNGMINSSEEQMSILISQHGDYKNQISCLENKLNVIDRERDDLQAMVDCKDERIKSFKNEIEEKSKITLEMRNERDKFNQTILIIKQELNEKNQQMSNINRSTDRYRDEYNNMKKLNENLEKDISQLHNDVSIMTRDKQNNNLKLYDLEAEKEDLKVKILDFVNAIKEMDKMLMDKDNDRCEILNQYQQSTMDLERLSVENQQYCNDFTSMKAELTNKESELRCLQERIAIINDQSNDTHQKLLSTEDKIMELNRDRKGAVQKMEFSDSEKEKYLEELRGTRQQVSHLEMSRDELQKDLASKSSELIRLSNMHQTVVIEMESLKKHSEEQRRLSDELQELLSNKRKREYELDLIDQHKMEEINKLKDKINILEEEISLKDKELNTFMYNNKNLEKQVLEIGEKLTHERFERERVVQELKRSSFRHTVPLTHAYSDRLSLSPSRMQQYASERSQLSEEPNSLALMNTKLATCVDASSSDEFEIVTTKDNVKFIMTEKVENGNDTESDWKVVLNRDVKNNDSWVFVENVDDTCTHVGEAKTNTTEIGKALENSYEIYKLEFEARRKIERRDSKCIKRKNMKMTKRKPNQEAIVMDSEKIRYRKKKSEPCKVQIPEAKSTDHLTTIVCTTEKVSASVFKSKTLKSKKSKSKTKGKSTISLKEMRKLDKNYEWIWKLFKTAPILKKKVMIDVETETDALIPVKEIVLHDRFIQTCNLQQEEVVESLQVNMSCIATVEEEEINQDVNFLNDEPSINSSDDEQVAQVVNLNREPKEKKKRLPPTWSKTNDRFFYKNSNKVKSRNYKNQHFSKRCFVGSRHSHDSIKLR